MSVSPQRNAVQRNATRFGPNASFESTRFDSNTLKLNLTQYGEAKSMSVSLSLSVIPLLVCLQIFVCV